MDAVQIFTDGACRGNPGPGGWGAVLKNGKSVRNLSGREEHTTNNRMEMSAAIHALNALKKPSTVDLTTDSEYLRKGITEWVDKWKANNWLTSQKKPVKNKDLWCDLLKARERHDVRWHWVKGHSGHPENEQADELATQAIDA